MKSAQVNVTKSIVLQWNTRLNLFFAEREGAQWYWTDRLRAFITTQIFKTMEQMYVQGQILRKDEYPPVLLDEKEWHFVVQCRESEEPKGGFVEMGDFVAITLCGSTEDLPWLAQNFAQHSSLV